ncbi:APC family permease [Nocardiopsis potens]|uniref:APC family permease n=1 Tax=Nocardiopsis potens TaxID=1246458 RepID=UPI000345CCD0|nr:APC family permease [Nocardiopsis potens]
MPTPTGPQARPARARGAAGLGAACAAAMIGAGVFAAFAPAAAGAGPWLPVALLLAAAVAYCNATCSARLAARHPEPEGAYVWGRERLGELWGHTAGWSFLVGKAASGAAMALAFASYVAPGWERPAAAAAVAALTALNMIGVRVTDRAAKVLLAATVTVLAVAVAAAAADGGADLRNLSLSGAWPGSFGLLGAAGMLFFAFTGYSRAAAPEGEVRDPRTTVPRAVALSIGGVLAVYMAVCLAALSVLGPDRLAAGAAPLLDLVRASGRPGLAPVVAAGAALACLGGLLAVLPRASRTAAEMASKGDLPRALAAVRPGKDTPYLAEPLLGAAALLLVLVADLGAAIVLAALGALVYSTIANASALRLGAEENRPPLLIALGGLGGCVVLALSLPLHLVAAGLAVIAAGALGRLLVRTLDARGG